MAKNTIQVTTTSPSKELIELVHQLSGITIEEATTLVNQKTFLYPTEHHDAITGYIIDEFKRLGCVATIIHRTF